MTRLLWRWALLLSGLLLLPVLLIRAQPYDDSGLRDFLTPPEGCPAPCFMGIRPGVTTVEQLLTILRQHPWAKPGSADEWRAAYATDPVLIWEWGEAAPDWIDRRENGYVKFIDERVDTLIIGTKLYWGEVVLVMGRPDQYRWNAVYADAASVSSYVYPYEGWYADSAILMVAYRRCRRSRVYGTLVHLQFQAAMPDLSTTSSPSWAVAECA